MTALRRGVAMGTEVCRSGLLQLLEEVYLELSAKLGWNPVNCYHYSAKYGVCYGAPVPLGNKEVWGREGLFEELNKKLVEKECKPITWEQLKQLIEEITRPGAVWASWFSSIYTKQVEPHDITIMKPLQEALKHSKPIYKVPGIYP